MNLKNLNKDREKYERRKTQIDLSTMVYGKVPPQARDLEGAILGALMLEPNAYDTIADKISPQVFYVEPNQRIFSAIQRLAAKSQPTDILTVCEELRRSEELEMVGGAYYVTKLTNAVVNSANIESHCRIILQKWIQREVIRVSGELISEAYEDGCDPLDLLDHAEEQLASVVQSLSIGDMKEIGTVLVATMQMVEKWRHLDSDLTGVPSGFPELDKATRGWQDTDLIILAARPSVGKTAFALNVVGNAASYFLNRKENKSVALWSLEMKGVKLVLRMLAAASKELLYKIQTGKITDEGMKRLYQRGVQYLAQLQIFIDDNSGLTMSKLRSKARKLKRKNNLALIVIDYLQLMGSDERSGNREQEVSKISRGLKSLAMELQVPIIALSQLSRDVEKRSGTKAIPQLSDLRESGSIEQDADLVMFLYPPADEDILKNPALLNRRYLRIAKQRDGVLITADLDFNQDIQFFEGATTGSTTFDFSQAKSTGGWRPVEIRDVLPPEKEDTTFTEDPPDLPF